MAQPTAQEQLMLELVNRARKNPQTEANLFGINLNEGLNPGTINNSPKQPLAFNFILIDAARNHSEWMLETDTFSHTGEGGSNPGDRMEAAGYEFIGSWSWGENIAWKGTSGQPNPTDFIIEEHQNLFLSPSHRENLLNGDFREVGIGAILGDFDGWNALMTTQNFAKTGSSIFLTGVAFDDSVTEDDFYTVGEGVAGVTVTAVRQSDNQSFSTTTMTAGGYQLALEPGTYNVTFAVEGQTTTEVITISSDSSENIKLDYIPTANSSPVVLIDLSGKSFNVLQDSLRVGETFDVNFIVQNTAIGAAGDFTVNFYISQNNWISDKDKFLGSYNINSLPGFSDTGIINQTFSLPDVNDSFWNNGNGTYYIGMLVDGEDEVFEINEDNNQNKGQFLDYDGVNIKTLADLKGNFFNVIQEPLTPGSNFEVEFQVENNSSGSSGGFEVDFYISQDKNFSELDQFLGSYLVENVAGFSETEKLKTSLSLPGVNDDFWQGNGDYYIGMIVDGNDEVMETSDTNNHNQGEFKDYDKVKLKLNFNPDLTGDLFDIIQEPLTAGDAFNVRFSVENNSGVSADGFAVDFYLSTNNYISTNDELLGSYTVNGLGGWKDTVELTTLLSLSDVDDTFWQGNDTYYVGMIIDSGNSIMEINEANNLNLGKFFDYDDVKITLDSGGI